MLTDASNHELDQLNKHAQQHRVNAGELGAREVALPGRPYGLHAGDEILFTAQHRVPGQDRVENGTRAEVVVANERDSRVLIHTQEPKPRDVEVSTSEFDGLRLAYAQHVYKTQGLTSDRSLVLTGGWQTDREAVYVALTRAREQTTIYTSREDLGHQGLEADAINRLAHRASRSNAQQASISRQHAEPDREPSRAVRELPERATATHRANVNVEETWSRTASQAAPCANSAKQCTNTNPANANAATHRPRTALPSGCARQSVRTRGATANARMRPAPGSFAEQLRAIEREQRGRDRDRGEGLEL